MFAENFFWAPFQRVFNVSVQGIRIASRFDLVALVGQKKAHVLEVNVTAPNADGENGYIGIILEPIIENPVINAIEIESLALEYIAVPTPAPVPNASSFQDFRINCGYNQPYNDSLGALWLPDQGFSGGQSSSSIIPDVLDTVDDLIYFYERVGNLFEYSFPVPEAVFQVTLVFAETYYNTTTQRVADITVEGATKESYDILTVVGPKTYTNLVFYPLVEDGMLTIEIKKSVAYPNSGPVKLNGIIVELDRPHVVHAVATGPYFGTVSDPQTGKAKIALKGETSHTHGPGLTLTTATWKEGSQILGSTYNLNYNFTAGNHTVSLSVEDSGGNVALDVATVSIRPFGYPTITQLSPASGDITGNYNVTITGSGFNYTASQMTVIFGQTQLAASDFQIINSTAIRVLVPSTPIGAPAQVIVTTPLGSSEIFYFNYVGSIPIQWATAKLFDAGGVTVGRFGPDKKLYVGDFGGSITKITMDADFESVVSSVKVNVAPGTVM
jgi:Malectin domain/IPT/TIG domain